MSGQRISSYLCTEFVSLFKFPQYFSPYYRRGLPLSGNLTVAAFNSAGQAFNMTFVLFAMHRLATHQTGSAPDTAKSMGFCTLGSELRRFNDRNVTAMQSSAALDETM
jgi:hypothetical protein